jgi:uncharacterized protein YbjT (DUF2867 family)
MRKIIITGATGNVGLAVIKSLTLIKGDFEIFAGLRDMNEPIDLSNPKKIRTIHFDFFDRDSIREALTDCHSLFLLRPPQISDVKKHFSPLINISKEKQVKHLVFLSVQGAEKSSWIPHHKIEKLILDSGINHTFLRPAYFMQNFTTTLRKDIVEKSRIYLSAGKAKFTLVDVEDVGAVAAEILANPLDHINKAYDLTNEENLDFEQMAYILSRELGRNIVYKSPNLLSFFLTKRKEGVPTMFVLVMIMLHYLPRFSRTPEISNSFENLTGRKPRRFEEFLRKNRDHLRPNE